MYKFTVSCTWENCNKVLSEQANQTKSIHFCYLQMKPFLLAVFGLWTMCSWQDVHFLNMEKNKNKVGTIRCQQWQRIYDLRKKCINTVLILSIYNVLVFYSCYLIRLLLNTDICPLVGSALLTFSQSLVWYHVLRQYNYTTNTVICVM